MRCQSCGGRAESDMNLVGPLSSSRSGGKGKNRSEPGTKPKMDVPSMHWVSEGKQKMGFGAQCVTD